MFKAAVYISPEDMLKTRKIFTTQLPYATDSVSEIGSQARFIRSMFISEMQ